MCCFLGVYFAFVALLNTGFDKQLYLDQIQCSFEGGQVPLRKDVCVTGPKPQNRIHTTITNDTGSVPYESLKT